MLSRTILPLAILFISACAQVPQEGTLQATPQSPTQEDTTPRADAAANASATLPAHAVRAAPSLESVSAPLSGTSRSVRPAGVAKPGSSELTGDTTAVSEPSAALPSVTVWDRIRGGFAMAPIDNELVRDWENWYSSRPDYVARMIGRSSRFLFHIVEEVEKRRMPMEVALLPMIESAYNPVAYSKSHASGIWQFIPSTGKSYGLRQNWWYDGRRDVIAATGAALDYLEKLYGMFGDWNLALASYNWGEGAVGRAIERNRAKGLPTDYESLTMPAETRNYLPKLIAVKNIISNPARYGLQIADVPNEPYFETVTVRRHIDVKVAAKLAEMPLDEFKFLNPGHNKPVIRAGEAERIVLPKYKVATFKSNLEAHDKPLVSWQAVTLRAGEKAEKVAASHGMTLAELKEVNGLAHQRNIVTGQPLLVPLKGGSAEPQLPDLPVNPVPLPKAIQAAKSSSSSKKYVQGAKPVATKAAQRGSVKGKKQPVPQLRAETGKRIKVVVPSKPAPSKKASAKVAAR